MGSFVELVEPSHFVSPRIRVLSVRVETDDEFVGRGQRTPICQCCRGTVEWEPDEDRTLGPGALYTTSYVRVTAIDTLDEGQERVTETVECCAYCAEEFREVLGPRSLQRGAAA